MGQFAFESSGKLAVPNPAELSALDEDNAILAYTNGQMPDGTPFYAYMAVKPSRYFEFMRHTSEQAPMVLAEFGEVLEADLEASPSEEVRKHMRDHYCFDEEYEQKLMRQVSQERGDFVKQQQENRIADGLAMLLKKKQGN